MEEDVNPKDEDGVDGRGVSGWDGWVCGLGAVGDSSIFGLVRRDGAFTGGLLTFPLVSGLQLGNITVVNATSSAQRFLHNLRRWSAAPWRGLRLYVSVWVSVGRSSNLDHALAHRIRVMGGWVIWVWWVPR